VLREEGRAGGQGQPLEQQLVGSSEPPTRAAAHRGSDVPNQTWFLPLAVARSTSARGIWQKSHRHRYVLQRSRLTLQRSTLRPFSSTLSPIAEAGPGASLDVDVVRLADIRRASRLGEAGRGRVREWAVEKGGESERSAPSQGGKSSCAERTEPGVERDGGRTSRRRPSGHHRRGGQTCRTGSQSPQRGRGG
jgi:hypothetical protein